MKIEALNQVRKKLDTGEKISYTDISQVVGKRHIDVNQRRFKGLSKLLGESFAPYELEELRYADEIASKERIPYSLVLSSIKNMDKHFKNAINLQPTNAKALLGSTSNVDSISILNNNEIAQEKIDIALTDALIEGNQLGKKHNQVYEEIQKIIDTDTKNGEKLPDKIQTKAEVIGFVLRTFKNAGGLKVKIADLKGEPDSGKKLGEWIANFFGKEKTKVGGAAAQIADFLKGTGGIKTVVYTQYNSPDQYDSYKNRPDFLKITGDEYTVVPMEKAVFKNDPVKINYPVEVAANTSVNFNGKNIKAQKADRVIFLSKYYDQNGHVVDLDPSLKFSPQVIEKIGREFDYFFITAPRYLQDLSKEKYDEIAPIMAQQLKTLKSMGVKILHEFSSGTTNIKYFADVLRGNISSLSINDDQELTDIVSSIKTELDPQIKLDNKKGRLAIYHNALSLAEYLGVDRLHVHSKISDIVIRKNASEEDLKKEVEALMHAKLRVVQWMRDQESKQITPEEEQPSPLLKKEGFIDVINFARDLAKDIFPNMLHVEKPDSYREVLIKRAKLIPNIIKNGYYRSEKADDYSVVIIPVKWIYDKAKVTTSSGDVIGVEAALRSGI